MTTAAVATNLVTVTIDGIEVQVPKGTLVVEAAKLIHRDIPVYCYHPKLGPAGLCRVCLVEVEGMPKLQIGCNTVVADGMKVNTQNAKVDEGRRAILEFLLLNHPLDCPICDKGGECDLQDYSMAYGQGASRLVDGKDSKPKAVDLGPTIVLDEERCILCLRCVRFDDIIAQERSLRTDDRGAHAIIATATGAPYVSDFSGNVTEICPVGALTSKTYRFKSRPWDNHRTETTCTQCSVGCQMNVDARLNLITRTMSEPGDDAISDGWLCDRGRYNIGYVGDERRITQPMYKHEGSWSQISWDDAIAMWATAIKESLAAKGASSIAAIGGGRLLNEEALLAAHVHRALGVENLDWRTGLQRSASPGEHGGTPQDLENAQVIITVGRSAAQLAPVLDLRIRKAVARHSALLIALGDHVASGMLPMKRASTIADVRALVPTDTKRLAIVTDGAASELKDALDAYAGELRGAGVSVVTFVLGEQANARGAEAMGMLPGPGGRDTAGIFAAARDGALGVLAILGANPILHFPDRALVEDALRATPFVVVSELFMTETAELATLVLPACAAFEKSGTTTNLAGDVLPVRAGVQAPDGTQADGDMLVALAEALGIAIPSHGELEARVHMLVKAVPYAAAPSAAHAAPAVPHGALKLVIDATILSGGGTVAFDTRLSELRTQPRAIVHPQTAAAAHIASGAHVTLTGATSGAKLGGLVLYTSERAVPGTVAIVDGLPQAPANTLGRDHAVHLTAEQA